MAQLAQRPAVILEDRRGDMEQRLCVIARARARAGDAVIAEHGYSREPIHAKTALVKTACEEQPFRDLPHAPPQILVATHTDGLRILEQRNAV
jgi:hypothetical protein